MSLSRFERTGTEISQHRRSAASQRGLIINTRNRRIIQFKKKYTFDGSGRCSLVLIVDLFSKNCQMGRCGLIRSWSKRYPSFDFLRWFSPVFLLFRNRDGNQKHQPSAENSLAISSSSSSSEILRLAISALPAETARES